MFIILSPRSTLCLEQSESEESVYRLPLQGRPLQLGPAVYRRRKSVYSHRPPEGAALEDVWKVVTTASE
jgi:hypothetical protein